MIYQLFSSALLTHAECTALITSQGQRFTYAEMNDRIYQWANFFIAQGIVSGDRIGLLTADEDHHVFVYLALDRINAVYVPFDIDLPPYQFKQALSILNLKRVLIDLLLTSDYPIDSASLIMLTEETLQRISHSTSTIPAEVYNTNPDKISYIMSSSGTTGNKKWIPIKGGGLLYWAKVENELLSLTPNDRVLSTRSPAYDAKISEYVRSFASGSSLYLLTASQRKDIQFVIQACNQFKITCLIFIASQLNGDYVDKTIKTLSQSGLKHLLVTGDACSKKLQHICEQYDVNLWNCYGPTEATFGLSILKVNKIYLTDSMESLIVPIGLPIGDAIKHHIIDERLYIESPYLTPGYINDDQLTHLSFPIIERHGQQIRVFDTGDRFSMKNSYLIFHGRHSAEVHCKVSGVKISPSYIERCINDYNHHVENDSSNITGVVVVKKWLDRDKPFAYVVVHDQFDKESFLKYLKTQLKKEEFPIIIRLSDFPRLNPSQKIDRKYLTDREDSFSEFLWNDNHTDNILKDNKEIANLSASFNVIQLLKQIWCDLFKLNDIHHDHEFLLLGGDSLTATIMVSRIQEQIDSNYRYADLLQLPVITINNIEKSIRCKKSAGKNLSIINLLVSNPNKPKIFFLPALLGEGCFSYMHLARTISIKFDAEIYGLSDPGLYNEQFLPDSLSHAATRYIDAIKTIQEKGPYHLLGFSFGCTLAHEVTHQLEQQHEEVKQLELLDGFPPLLYQNLPRNAHAILLENLINFMISTLNNSFYAENVKKIKLTGFDTLSLEEQLKKAFEYIDSKIKHATSKRVTQVAKRHLTFMLTSIPPMTRCNTWPSLYLTNNQQDYLDVINKIPTVSNVSTDHQYYFWNHYFYHMTRSGKELVSDHLSLLKNNIPNGNTVAAYWQRNFDSLFNLKTDSIGPPPFYILEPLDENQYLLIIYFLPQEYLLSYMKLLDQLGIILHSFNLDKNMEKFMHNDTNLSTQSVLSCRFDRTSLDRVQSCLNEKPSLKRQQASFFSAKRTMPVDIQAILSIHLSVYWGRGLHVMDLSFEPQRLSRTVITELSDKLKIKPQNDSSNNFLNYQYKFMIKADSIYEAVDAMKLWLAELITIIDAYIVKDHDRQLSKILF